MHKQELLTITSGIVLFSAFGGVLLGFSSFRTLLGFGLATLCIYIFLELFSFTIEERLIFALFMSVVLLPSLVYGLGFLISFKLALLIVMGLFVVIGIGSAHMRKSKTQHDSKHGQEEHLKSE